MQDIKSVKLKRFSVVLINIIGESTKHGPLVHGPPLWTGSMDRVHQNMDRVHGPPFMDRVHGPPIFTSWGCTINYDLMTFDDTLRDGSSFGKPCISLTAHLPLKFMLNSSFSLSLVILTHTVRFWKAIIVLYLLFSLSWQHKYQHLRADLSMVYCQQTQREYFCWWIKIGSISIAVL